MAWSAPVNPVGGTVITVAYAVANILDPIRWLRIMTGNSDPPASSYVPVSSSTTAVGWGKVTADVLASGAAQGNLGYRPVNAGGDTGMTGNYTTTGQMTADRLNAGPSGIVTAGPIGASQYIQATGDIIAGGGIAAARYAGGSLATGVINLFGLAVGTNGVQSAGGFTTSGVGGVATTNAVSAGYYVGGSLLTGVPNFLGIGVGTGGISLGGPIVGSAGSSLSVTGSVSADGNVVVGGAVNAVGEVRGGSFAGGSTTIGHPSFHGLSVGTDGIVTSGAVVVFGTEQVYSPSNPPPTAGGGASVPSGLIAFIATGAKPPGWDFYPAANGRVIVGAGSASVGNPQTFVVGTNYGADWAHVHNPNTFTVTGAATFGPSDMTQASSDVNGLALAGGVNLNTTGHRHSLNGASADVSGSATGATAGAVWVPPAHALNAIIKA